MSDALFNAFAETMDADDTLPQKDPFDWGIDEVVQAFCSPNGILDRHDAVWKLDEIEKDLRANDVTGEVLLSELHDRGTFKEVFKISSLGKGSLFTKEVRRLRAISEKWRQVPEAMQGYNNLQSPSPAVGFGSFGDKR